MIRHLLAASPILLALAAPATATVATFQPAAQDAYVRQNLPDQVFGGGPENTRIRVSSAFSAPNPFLRRGLVQFDLSSIPERSTIASAFLELNEESEPLNAPRIHGAHRLLGDWREVTVSWTNQPPAAVVPTATTTVGTRRTVRRFDVTADVRAFVADPTLNHGWMLRDEAEGDGEGRVAYAATEARDVPPSHRPRLVLDYTAFVCQADADCADDNLCTGRERCTGGRCLVDPIVCAPSDACSQTICDPARGCVTTVSNCVDAFSCTQDSCDPERGCQHAAREGSCPSDDCSTNGCIADPDDPAVDPTTGCGTIELQPDGATCTADANPCSSDVCTAGRCTHAPGPAGAPCSDANACTVTDRCDADGACVPGARVVCRPLDQCHNAGACNPATGVCSDPPAPASASCEDGNHCTTGDQCDGSGSCVSGVPVTCAPAPACYAAAMCTPATGACATTPLPDGSSCDDGNPCTADVCTGGACVSTSLPDDTPCSDGGVCTPEGACRSGVCLSASELARLCESNLVVAGITNFRDGTFSLIDVDAARVVATLPVGNGPWGVAVRPGGRELWVSNRKEATIAIVDSTERRVVDTIAVGRIPQGIVFTADGTRAYVASYGDDRVDVIDATNRTPLRRIRVGRGPSGLLLDADTETLYVANYGADTVAVVDTRTDGLVATIPAGRQPLHLALDAPRGRVYVTSFRNGTVAVIGTVSKTVLATLDVGRKPFGIAVDSARGRAFVTNAADDTVSIIDTAVNRVIETIPVPRGPLGVAIDPAGRAYIAESKSGTLSILDPNTRTIIGTIPVGGVPVAAGEFLGSLALGCPTVAPVCDDRDSSTLDLCDPGTGCSHFAADSIAALAPLLDELQRTLDGAPAGTFRDPALVTTLRRQLDATRALVTGSPARRRPAVTSRLTRLIARLERGLRTDAIDRDVGFRLLDIARRARILSVRPR